MSIQVPENMNDNLKKCLYANGEPKRILSLDGGGIRGVLTLGMLEKIEQLVREKTGKKDMLLGEYYDLIGGTSTGAIIAAALAIGKSVEEIKALYLGLGSKIFGDGRKCKIIPRSSKIIRSAFVENYSSKKLEDYLFETFREINLADTRNLICGLAINTKRADTYSLWTFVNHPGWEYYVPNGHVKLWELCRASSAAPYYFKPKKLNLRTRKGEPVVSTFIDGGVSLANNPAWQTFLAATLPSWGFNWDTGKDKLFITSLGTGNGTKKEDPDKLVKTRALLWAPKLSDLFMVDALEMNQVLLQSFGNNTGPEHQINRQLQTYDEHQQMKVRPASLFSFARYNVSITTDDLAAIGITSTDAEVNSLKEMDHYENMDRLLEIGRTYASKNIDQRAIF